MLFRKEAEILGEGGRVVEASSAYDRPEKDSIDTEWINQELFSSKSFDLVFSTEQN